MKSESTENERVVSPFADSEVEISKTVVGGRKFILILCSSLMLILAGSFTAIIVLRYLNDPFRTLESLPVSKYLDNYQGLVGSKFKAEFRVEADLGWKENVGRLMLFSTTEDSRPIAVFIPAAVAKDIYFTKGQIYLAEVEVKEGGLMYANSFQKN